MVHELEEDLSRFKVGHYPMSGAARVGDTEERRDRFAMSSADGRLLNRTVARPTQAKASTALVPR